MYLVLQFLQLISYHGVVHSSCVPEVLLFEVAELAVQFMEILCELSFTGRGVTDVAVGGEGRSEGVCSEGVCSEGVGVREWVRVWRECGMGVVWE